MFQGHRLAPTARPAPPSALLQWKEGTQGQGPGRRCGEPERGCFGDSPARRSVVEATLLRPRLLAGACPRRAARPRAWERCKPARPLPATPHPNPRTRSLRRPGPRPAARGERTAEATVWLGGWCARGPAERRAGPGGGGLRVLVDLDRVPADFEGGFLGKFCVRLPDQPFIALENRTDVSVCTSPIKMYEYCPYEKYAWAEKHLGPAFLEQVVLTRDKTVVSADLLIDDQLDITGAEPSPSREYVLFTACCNQHLPLQTPSRRLLSWADDRKALLDSKRSC